MRAAMIVTESAGLIDAALFASSGAAFLTAPFRRSFLAIGISHLPVFPFLRHF